MKKNTGQSIIEYAVIIGVVAVAALPLISPYAREVGQKIANSAPAKSPTINEITFTEKKAVEPQGLNPTPPNIDPVPSTPKDPDKSTPKDPPKDPPEDPPEAPPKVFIIGSYSQPWFTLEMSLMDFAGIERNYGYIGNYSSYAPWNMHNHDFNKSNDAALRGLLSKLSSKDKKLDFSQGQAYIITEEGKVLGMVPAIQLLNGNTAALNSSRGNPLPFDKDFSINKSVGVYTGNMYTDRSCSGGWVGCKNNEEGTGGKITYKGVQYDVVSTVIRKETPLVFDITGSGFATSENKILFDINGDGKNEFVNDVLNGVLCIRGGKSGLDLFGNNTDLNNDRKPDGYKDGFQALKALAAKEMLINYRNDMKLDSKDIIWLQKKYNFGMKVGGYHGKLLTLDKLGITEIALGSTSKTTIHENFDEKGNILLQQQGASFIINGKQNVFADVVHKVEDFVKNTVQDVKELFTA